MIDKKVMTSYKNNCPPLKVDYFNKLWQKLW